MFRAVVIASWIFCQISLLEGAFIPPSENHIQQIPYNKMESSFKIRKVTLGGEYQFEEITSLEKEGFLGYHGDSIEFMIYQDIIRYVMETILEISIPEDFHFLAVPLDPSLEIQTKEKLAQVFNEMDNPALILSESTFPLNFSIWDNSNRLGLNSIELYLKNESMRSAGYKKRLKWLFKRLGIKEGEIDTLFQSSILELNSKEGVLLQVFDESKDLYAMAKLIAYPAYPNGYIALNKTVDEIFLDESFIPPYPHEVRLMLTNNTTLNPKSPLKIVRHTPNIGEATLLKYKTQLKNKIKKLSFKASEKKSYKNALLKSWRMD